MSIDGLEVKETDGSWQEKVWDFIFANKIPVALFIVALIFLGAGIYFIRSNTSSSGVEIIENSPSITTAEIVVEVAGAVEKPGVYKLPSDARVEDLLVLAGGVSGLADREWMQKALNRAAKLIDGQKLYIPTVGEQLEGLSANNSGLYQNGAAVIGAQTEGVTNINVASLSELDKLPGIGPVYGQKIIDQRPYSNVSELSSRGVIPPETYQKLKDLVSVY